MINRGWKLLLYLLVQHGMILVLLLLCLILSILTYSEQFPTGGFAADQVAREILSRGLANQEVLIVGSDTEEDRAFGQRLREQLEGQGFQVTEVQGEPRDTRIALERYGQQGQQSSLDVIACAPTPATWLIWANRTAQQQAQVVSPRSYNWPNFLTTNNLLNVANQVAIIAIVAIGMTMVIITAGIDLSVGSLIALSAVTCSLLIQEVFGARAASPLLMVCACLVAILVCGLMGALNGVLITWGNLPPFIITLAMMLVASGIALRLTDGETVYELPDSFIWLGRGADLFGVPNAVVLMLILYALAHILMTRMTLGRYLYAVGGNAEAARLSGVPLQRVTLFAYVCSGLLAGLGGVIMTSQLKSGSPNYGGGYELQVIAAVVVGGTSLSGGEGQMLGTLVGALIIAVIHNGMNLTNINPFTQKIVLGMVIVLAVLFDRLKHRISLGVPVS